jgi:hypothetical protein
LNDPDFNWLQFGPGVSNVRQLGFYGLVLVGIGVGLLASGYAPRRDWLHSALLLIGYYMVDWSGGRAAFVAAIAATFIVIALAPTVTRRRTVAFALAAFILALPLSLAVVPHQSWGIWSTFMRAMPDGNGSSYSSDRMEIWVQPFEEYWITPSSAMA